jgi:hypothetical protein
MPCNSITRSGSHFHWWYHGRRSYDTNWYSDTYSIWSILNNRWRSHGPNTSNQQPGNRPRKCILDWNPGNVGSLTWGLKCSASFNPSITLSASRSSKKIIGSWSSDLLIRSIPSTVSWENIEISWILVWKNACWQIPNCWRFFHLFWLEGFSCKVERLVLIWFVATLFGINSDSSKVNYRMLDVCLLHIPLYEVCT